MSGLLSSSDGHLRSLNYAWQDNTDASGSEVGDRVSLSRWHSDIGLPIHFQEESGIITFWSIEFIVPLELSKGYEASVQMKWGTRVFSRVSKGDSDIPSSCEMKDKPAFTPLQGNLTLFLLRAFRFPLHLRQQIQGPSYITVAEGRLLLKCLWKVSPSVQ